MEKSVIIVIDMLNDFVTGKLKTNGAEKIVPILKKLIDEGRKKGVPIVYADDAHLSIDPEVINRWGLHAVKGTKGAQVIPELKPTSKDFVVEKRTYSAFYETGLDNILRGLYDGEGAKTVVLSGLHTHICVRHTAADAFYRGYKIIIVKDGVTAFTQKQHQEGLNYLKDVYSADVMTSDEIVKEFKAESRHYLKPEEQ